MLLYYVQPKSQYSSVARPTYALLFVRPANSFVGFLVAELVLYCVEVQLIKVLYIRLFKILI